MVQRPDRVTPFNATGSGFNEAAPVMVQRLTQSREDFFCLFLASMRLHR